MFFERSKALAVAKYLLDQTRAAGFVVTPMQLLKLVYIAHGWMLGSHGRPLFNESVEAWQYGPVVPSVYQSLKRFGSSSVQCVDGAPEVQFDQDERAIMDFVSRNYGAANGVTLSAATHKAGTPWSVTWGSQSKSAPISNDLIQNFYASLIHLPTHSSL